MVDLADRADLMSRDGQPAFLPQPSYIYDPAQDKWMYDSSSWGPSNVDFRVKPDALAPAEMVISSIPTAYCAGEPCFAFFSGTSMATPHLAGSAAIIHQQHPDWSAAQIRSAIANTADRFSVKDSSGTASIQDVNVIGGGLENLYNAVNAQVALDPVSLSFGAIPTGSGQSDDLVVTLTNLSSAAASLEVAVEAGDASVSFSVSPATVNLAAGESAQVTVTMSAIKDAQVGPHQAWLTVTQAAVEVAHAAVFVWVK
jgi:subtilisin family serine protease